MADADPIISVIIVNWNTRDELAACLDSLRRHPPEASHEVIVVDNASADGSADLVAEAYPEVRLITADRNLGFAGGNNRGVEAARGRYFMFLNSDAEVTAGVLDAMLGVFDAHRDDAAPVGAVGCRLVYPDGRLQRSARELPTFPAVFHQHTVLKYVQVLRRAEARNKMADFGFDAERDVGTLMGAALMVDRRAFERIGGWDDGYPFRYEDADFTYRLREAGYRCLFSPCGEVVHHSGTATKRAPRLHAMTFRGMFRYFRRSRGRGRTALFKLAFIPLHAARLAVNSPARMLQALASRCRGDRDRARRRWSGALDDLRALICDAWRMWLW